jgi:hypothetical protein
MATLKVNFAARKGNQFRQFKEALGFTGEARARVTQVLRLG